jgi:hypothetical protein
MEENIGVNDVDSSHHETMGIASSWLVTHPIRVYGCEIGLTPDKELLRLIRQLQASDKYYEMARYEQKLLNEAIYEWKMPLDECERAWCYKFLERFAEEYKL